jgi:hypothetical protein
MNFIFKTLDPFILCIGRNELYALAHTQILTYCLIYSLQLLYLAAVIACSFIW